MYWEKLRPVTGASLAVCCAVIGSLFAFVSPAWSEPYPNVPTPTVEGPVAVTPTSHPFLATEIPLASYGYTEKEYFISGTGYTYNTSGAFNVTGTKILTGGPHGDGTYPFKTRLVVRMPTNPADFNGKVIVEWNNVTAGYDLEVNWFGDPYYLIKNGYAYVTVSAQNVGVNFLKAFNFERYGSLEVGPAGDPLSYDIYAAAVKAVRGDVSSGPEPLGSLTPHIETVAASGESQSCGRLVTYFNKVAPLQEIVNSYLLTVCTTAIRADRPEKVLRIITEFENKIQQTEAEAPTNPSLRHWEAAGGSHVPFDAAAYWQGPVARDTTALLGPNIAECTHKPILSRVGWPDLVNVGTKDLIEWSKGGSAPPVAPRGEYETPTKLKRNGLGIALGGIRLPEMEVPTGVNLAENSGVPKSPYPDSAFCVLLGQYDPFSEATLEGLYDTYGEYVDKVKADTETLEDEGLLLPEDAQRLVNGAEEFPRLRPTIPALGGSPPNEGAFDLAWRGPVPSHEESLVARFVETHPTHELQHRSAVPGSEWTTIASSLNKPAYSFSLPAKPEEEGIWSYRVRSRTVVPAFDLEPEEVIVTPWSEILSNVLVTKKSNLHGANLEGVNLEGDNLPEANLKGANLQGANLQKANLQGANLNGVHGSGANFAGANLEGANLSKANLTGANLSGANTKGANLNKITWSNTICPDGSNSNSDGGTCVNNLS